MKEKWLFIIRPNRMDNSAIVHWTITVNATTEEEIKKELDDFVYKEFSSRILDKASWILADKKMENFIISDNMEDADIYTDDEHIWCFVDTGYAARAIYLPTGQAFDVMSTNIRTMIADAEELMSE